jgi:hypothetical protein
VIPALCAVVVLTGLFALFLLRAGTGIETNEEEGH